MPSAQLHTILSHRVVETPKGAKIDPETKPRMMGMPSPIRLKTPGVMSTADLAAWARIGKNGVPHLVAKFRIRELTGNAKNHRFPAHDVFAKILGVTPRTAEDMETLLLPLQKVSWVSQITGQSTSAISANVCEERGLVPSPIELTETEPGQAPARGRRWVPAQIEAFLRGDPIPFLPTQTPSRQPSAKRSQTGARNVFAAIRASNAPTSL